MLFQIFLADLQALDGGVIHPVTVAFKNHDIDIGGKCLFHQTVQVYAAGAKLHSEKPIQRSE